MRRALDGAHDGEPFASLAGLSDVESAAVAVVTAHRIAAPYIDVLATARHAARKALSPTGTRREDARRKARARALDRLPAAERDELARAHVGIGAMVGRTRPLDRTGALARDLRDAGVPLRGIADMLRALGLDSLAGSEQEVAKRLGERIARDRKRRAVGIAAEYLDAAVRGRTRVVAGRALASTRVRQQRTPVRDPPRKRGR